MVAIFGSLPFLLSELDFTFSEAFKLCRQCQGNDGIFYWKDNLYLTEIKENNEKITKEELIDLKPLQK